MRKLVVWVIAVLAIVAVAIGVRRWRQGAGSFERMTKLRVVHRVDGMDRVGVRRDLVYKTLGTDALRMDVYSPSGTSAKRPPAVILVHGGPIERSMRPKDWGVYVSYGELLAASGMTAVTFDHRLYGYTPEHLRAAAADVGELVRVVREQADDLGLDRERIAIWAFSGGGPLLSAPIAESAGYLKCVVAYYAVLDLQVAPAGQEAAIDAATRREFSPVYQLERSARRPPPLLVARAGKDDPWLLATVDRFAMRAGALRLPITLVVHPQGQHGFDIFDDDERSREIVQETLGFLRQHLW